MILSEIKQYLSNVKKANLDHLSQKFNIDTQVMQDMLSLWVGKGVLKKTNLSINCTSNCTQCQGCVFSALEIYELLE